MRVRAIIAAAALVGCAGCSAAVPTPTVTATTTDTVTATATVTSSPSASALAGPTLASGIYVDGPPGTPHYFVTLTAAADGTIAGTLAFIAQDGQTTEARPFTGQVLDGIATLNFKGGSTGTASVGTAGFELGECQQWMSFAQSRTDCDFHLASSIN